MIKNIYYIALKILTLSSISLSDMALLMDKYPRPPRTKAGFVVKDPVSEAATLATSSASESSEDNLPNQSCFFFMMRSRKSCEFSCSGLDMFKSRLGGLLGSILTPDPEMKTGFSRMKSLAKNQSGKEDKYPLSISNHSW